MNPLLITPLFELGKNLINRLFPDPEQKAAAELELLKLQQSGELAQLDAEVRLRLGQLEVNKIEAASEKLFVSGWRPAVGWVCVAALAWHFIGYPFSAWAFQTWIPQVAPPVLVGEHLMELVIGMLGFGTLRTYEKIKGLDK